MKENFELKRLCIELDQELRGQGTEETGDRDQGDGSSNTTPTGEEGKPADVSANLSEELSRQRGVNGT